MSLQPKKPSAAPLLIATALIGCMYAGLIAYWLTHHASPKRAISSNADHVQN